MSKFDLLHLAWWQVVVFGFLVGFGQGAGAWMWGGVVNAFRKRT